MLALLMFNLQVTYMDDRAIVPLMITRELNFSLLRSRLKIRIPTNTQYEDIYPYLCLKVHLSCSIRLVSCYLDPIHVPVSSENRQHC
jgi:hypothetical protein